MEELIENIEAIEGLLSYEIQEGVWENELGESVNVHLIILEHEFASFNDPFYEELVELYPENTDEFDRDEEVYTSTFVVV